MPVTVAGGHGRVGGPHSTTTTGTGTTTASTHGTTPRYPCARGCAEAGKAFRVQFVLTRILSDSERGWGVAIAIVIIIITVTNNNVQWYNTDTSLTDKPTINNMVRSNNRRGRK